MNKPDIVLISSPRGHFSPIASGAIATWLYEVARAAQNEGYAPLVVARHAPYPPYEKIAARFVDYPREPQTPPTLKIARAFRKIGGWPHVGQRTYARRVAQLLKNESLLEVPIVINNDPELAIWLSEQFPQARLTHHFHNLMTMEAPWKARFGAAPLNLSAVSEFNSSWIEREYGRTPASVKTVYNGVDSAVFCPAARQSEGPPVINFCGRTGIEKGADILLDAALILAKTSLQTPFALQIVGANNWTGFQLDDYQKQLIERVEKLEKLGVSVRQTGHVNRAEIPAQFQRAHIHVVPSRWDEPFGLTTVEGMASGLATLASNTGGSPEIIGDAGKLFERDNPQDLAEKIRPWLQNPALRREMGLKARARAAQFSWSNSWRALRAAVQI